MLGFKSGNQRKRKGYADGGKVTDDKGAKQGASGSTPAATGTTPAMLGTGAAANAAKSLQGRRAQLDAAIDGYADGGKVRGPGTGTSDDVKATVPEGSYIMPADSTEQIGDAALGGMGKDVPVNLSNGEFNMPPEQVHAIGVQALDQMKNATHTPVAEQGKGFAPGAQAAGEPDMFFANGGPVFSGVDPDELGRSNTPKRGVIPKQPPSFHVDSSGTATRSLPSSSRAVVPYQGPGTQMTTTAQPRPAPAPAPQADFYGNSRGATGRGFQPSSSTAVTPAGPVTTHQQPPRPAAPQRPALPAPGAAPSPSPQYEPDYKTRAESKARAARDTAAFEAERTKVDAKFNQAAQKGVAPAASPSGGVRGFINKAGKAGAVLAAAPALLSAADEDSTARYAERFGVDEPTGDGSAADIAKFAALRAGGFASDLGSSMTFGLADGLYRDKQGVDTELLGGGAGAVAGGVTGNKLGAAVGKAVDKGIGFATRGRYKRNSAENIGRKLGTAGGAVGGYSAGAAIGRPDGELEAAQPDPAQAAARVIASTENQSSGMEPQWSRTGVDEIAGQIGADGVPSFSNDPSIYAGAGDIPQGGFADTRGAGFQPGGMTAPAGARVLASGSSVQGENQGVGSMANIGNGVGGLSVGEPGDAKLAYDRNERAIAEREKMIQASRRGAIGEGGGRVTVVKDSSRTPTRDDRLRARNDEQVARTEALRSEAKLGFKRDARADSQLELDRQRLGIDQQKGMMELEDRQRIQALYAQYEQAIPAERAAIAEQIRVLTGKEQASRFTVVPGGQAVNKDGTAYTLPSTVINNQSGEFMSQPESQYQGGQSYPVGTRSTLKNGKVAVWDGSQWIPQ